LEAGRTTTQVSPLGLFCPLDGRGGDFFHRDAARAFRLVRLVQDAFVDPGNGALDHAWI
jgi:hypothetical protein